MKRIVSLIAAIILTQQIIAQTAIQTSFETSGSYAVGNLHAQNGWQVSNGAATVINTKAKTGSQSVALSASSAALVVNQVVYAGNVPGITGDVYADMWINPNSFTTRGIAVNGYDLYGGSQKRIFVIEFTTDNKIKAYNGSSGVNVGTWSTDQWVRISVKVDFAAEKYKVAIDGVVFATDMNFRETYTPTASGSRAAGIKEFHSIRFNHTSDSQVASSSAVLDDLYIGTTPITDVPFGASSTTRTITVTQPEYGSITLNPASATYNLGQSVTATLTVPAGYVNTGWTGDLSGTTLQETFTVTGNMTIGANVGIDAINPPPKYKITIAAPLNGSISLVPYNADSMYYKETKVVATISYEACYQFNGWTGSISGTQASNSFTVQGNMTIGADISLNNTPSIKRSVSTVTEFKNALAAMNPGDTVEVANGSYNLGNLTISRSGCGLKPILIVAKNQGQAILSGSTSIILKNMRYTTLKGFSIQSANISTGIKLENCNRVHITRNSFSITENSSCNWLYIGDTYASPDSLKSGNNKIDYNSFDGKTFPGKYIVIDGNIDQQSRHDTISYNLFKNNGPRADNEKESIRVGVSALTRSSGYTVIEYNRFEDCDGDPEIVSIKSCDNIVRFNTFVRCLGTLSLRQGFRNTVEGNYFFGEGKTAIFNGSEIGCGGIRVYGKDHKIINNYFHGLTGSKWDAAITITNGDATNVNYNNSDHNIPENVVIAFNTLVNNFSNIEIGFTNNGNYNKAPVNCLIANNIVVDSINPIVKSFGAASLAGVAFSNNIMYPTVTSSIGIAVPSSQINNIDPVLVQPGCITAGDPCQAMLAYKVKRLSPFSPAIDAATGSYAYVTTDFEYTSRTGVKDIGAHEYTGNNTIAHGPLEPMNVGTTALPMSYTYDYSGILPVKLLGFTATYNNGTVQLKWNVTNEDNVKQYELEWSDNAASFKRFDVVAARQLSNYMAVHHNPTAGKNFYRLKVLDENGKHAYSQVRMVTISGKTNWVLYPNPASRFIRIQATGYSSIMDVRFVSSLGVEVKRVSNVVPGTNISIAELQPGIYKVLVYDSHNMVFSSSVSIIK